MMMRTEQEQQDGIRRCIPCYDEMIAFLKSWFSKTGVKPEEPIFVIGRYSGSAAQWQEIAKWAIKADYTGKLETISLASDDYATAIWWIKIGFKEQKEKQIITALTMRWSEIKLPPGTQVVVYGKSDGATSIIMDAVIVGKQSLV